MQTNKKDESVKAGLEIAADTNAGNDENMQTDLITENEKDLDEVVHEQTNLGNIENVEGEADVDDLVHKLPVQPEPGIENKEEDIDDLLHRK